MSGRRALAGEGEWNGTLLMSRGETSRPVYRGSRSRSKSRDPNNNNTIRDKQQQHGVVSVSLLPWDERLKSVQKTLESINRDGIAVRLVDNVSKHLHATIVEMNKLKALPDDDDENSMMMKWYELVDLFLDSRDFYADKADTLSIFTGDSSPFHLFDAIARGLEFNEEEAKKLQNPDARGEFLSRILSNVGKRIESLNAKHYGYFDRVISKGSGVLFSKIAILLQGIPEYSSSGTAAGAVVVGSFDDSYDWRTALSRVLGKVNRMKRPDDLFVGAIYDQTKNHLNTTIENLRKISEDDLKRDGDLWGRVYDKLRERMISFEFPSRLPHVGKLFDAIRSGLKVIGTRSDWVGLSKSKREHMMEVVLKSIGSQLKKLGREYYDGFLPNGGGKIMGDIADILSGVGE